MIAFLFSLMVNPLIWVTDYGCSEQDLNIVDQMACNITVNAGPDITICSGESGVLCGSVVGPYDEFEWMPATGLSDPFDLKPTVTITTPTIYKLVARGVGSDLVMNGGFESGNINPATSGFNFVAPGNFALAPGGSYTIGSNTTFGNIWGCSPNSGTYALAFNGAGAAGTPVWSQTVSVTPNTEYKFECFLMGIVIPFITTPSSITIDVNGMNIASGVAPGSSCSWIAVNGTWNSGGAASATITITSNNGGANWGALDDISFVECCVIEDEVFVDVVDVQALAAPAGPITCDNPRLILDGTGSSMGPNYMYLWTTTDGQIVAGQMTLNPTITMPGTYTLTVTGPAGCEKEVTIVVDGNVIPPQVRTFAEILTCERLQARVTANSPSFGVDYSWTGPNGFISFDESFLTDEPGWYYVIVEDEFNCKGIDSIEVLDQRAYPEINISGDTLKCGVDTIDLEAISTSWNLKYEWIGPNGFTSKDSIITVGDSGIYILMVIDSNDCVSGDTFRLIKNNELPGVSASGDTITCDQPFATLSGSSDSSNVVFEWRGPNGFMQTGQEIMVSDSGVYILEVILSGGCSAFDTVIVIKEDDVPNIAVRGDTITCIDTTANLIGSTNTPNANFEWNGPNGFNSDQADISVKEPGTYIFTVTGSNGCKIELPFEVILDQQQPAIELVRDTLTCLKDSIQLTYNGDDTGLVINWNGPNGFFSSENNPIIVNGGRYIISAIGDNGCLLEDTVDIVENFDKPTATITADTINCIKSVAMVESTVDDMDASFNWIGPNGFTDDSPNFTTSEPGLYEVTITGSNGCQSIVVVEVKADTIKPEFLLIADTLDCSTPSIRLSVLNPSNGAFIWRGPNGFTSNEISPEVRDSGYYVLRLVGDNGCEKIDSIFIEQTETTPHIEANADTITCSKDSAFIRGASNDNNVTFEWTGPNGFGSTSPINSVKDTGTYTFIVRTDAGCFSEITINVVGDLDGPEIIDLYSDGLECDSNSTTINLVVGPRVNDIIWTGPNGFTSSVQSPLVSSVGWYWVEVVGENGCLTLDSIYIVAQDVIPDAIAMGDTLTCDNPTARLIGSSATPNVTYEWLGPNGVISTDSTTTTQQAGEYTFVVTSDNGCTGTWVVTVDTNYSTPQIGVSIDSIRCDEAPGQFSANLSPMGSSVQWTSPSGEISTDANYQVIETGQYQLISKHPISGCPDTAYFEMVRSSDTISLVEVDVVGIGCDEEYGEISVISVVGSKGPYRYAIDQGGFGPDATFMNVNAGLHEIIVEDIFGCSYLVNVLVDSTSQGTISAPMEITIKKGGNASINVNVSLPLGDIDSIAWDPASGLSCTDCLNPIASPDETTTYTIWVWTKDGCLLSASTTIVVIKNNNFYVPNSFSPNGDGLNDKLYIFGDQNADVLSLKIFNRWGELVFTAQPGKAGDDAVGWDGRFRGEDVIPGVFVYHAIIEVDGEVIEKSGDVTLIR